MRSSRRNRLAILELESRLTPAFVGLVQPAVGDFNGDGFTDLAIAQASDGGAITVFDGLTGRNTLTLTPFDGFTGGVAVAAGDIDGDGRAEIIAGAGVGGAPRVSIFDGTTGAPLQSLFAYEPTFRGGVEVAAADVTGDGKAELITAAGTGGGPRVQVTDLTTGAVVADFFAYESTFRGGVRVAAADMDGDGIAEIVTGAGDGGGPRVRVFDARTGAVRADFQAFESSFRGGVRVAAADTDGDGIPEIVTGAGDGGGPVVGVFRRDGAAVGQFLAGPADARSGATVAVGDLRGDGSAVIVAGGMGGAAAFSGATFAQAEDVAPINPDAADTIGPRVMAVASTGSTTLRVEFSEPIDTPRPGDFTVVDLTAGTGVLPVTDVRFTTDDHTVVELSTPPQAAATYALTQVFVKDLAGNPAAGATLRQFPGTGPAVPKDETPPRLVRATSTGNTTVRVVFSEPVAAAAADPQNFAVAGPTGATLTVTAVRFVTADHTAVELTTNPQADAAYSLTVVAAADLAGNPLEAGAVTFNGSTPAVPPAPVDTTGPRVIGAASVSNKVVRVVFSEPVTAATANRLNFAITQVNFNSDVGVLPVTAAALAADDPSVVVLTTESQNELTYRVTVLTATDLAGNLLAPPATSNGQLIETAKATFNGTPPTGDDLKADTDGDGLSDSEERRGWQVVFKPANGQPVTRWVTSDPYLADTDGDKFPDNVEAQLRLDPRDTDTDDDLLSDWREYTEIFSDHLNGDTDGDGVDDGTEYLSVLSSPVHADTDGDQIPDADEIALGGIRNVLVSNLPQPQIDIGQTDLQLDVRFTTTEDNQTRTLQSKSVSSTLQQSASKSGSRTNELTNAWSLEASIAVGDEPTGRGVAFASTEETLGYNGSYTTSNTVESQSETLAAYEDSLTTDVEGTAGVSVTREVVGAKMQVAVSLSATGTVPFRISNVQVTAFLQDPLSPSVLTPVATLLPDAEPADGFTVGPLNPARGPIIFSNSGIYPNAVEALMRNPHGLVLRLSNYTLTDELGRNFDFNSRAVAERTALVVIDNGTYDQNNDGVGDGAEYAHVATYGGRPLEDTNGDGKLTSVTYTDSDDKDVEADYRLTFDKLGRQLGITFRTALQNMGLIAYDESKHPSSTLSLAERQSSYSTVTGKDGRVSIYRVRDVAEDPNKPYRAWYVVTPRVAYRSLDLDTLILRTGDQVNLAFVTDQDGDGLTSNIEYIYGSSDTDEDSDDDGLSDLIEIKGGWSVDTPRGVKRVFSSPTNPDTDADGIPDNQEAPGVAYDDDPTDKDPRPNALRRRTTARTPSPDGGVSQYPKNAVSENLPFDTLLVDFVTDPTSSDTDGDGVSDRDELRGMSIPLRSGNPSDVLRTDPENPDTDGDSGHDGLEEGLGGDPTDPDDRDKYIDADRDGLVNVEEDDPKNTTLAAYNLSYQDKDGKAQPFVFVSKPGVADTDGDGLSDGEEFQRKTNPRSADTDDDGLSDLEEVRGITVHDFGQLTLDPLKADTDGDGLTDGEEVEVRADYWRDTWLKGFVNGRPPAAAPITSPVRAIDPANFWVVRVAGKVPYRVYSDPTVADADFDGLSDGQEKYVGGKFVAGATPRMSDPKKADTDADGRPDALDIEHGLSPTVEDFLVTVSFNSLSIDHDGDEWKPDSNDPDDATYAGDFGFAFGVRRPDALQPSGLEEYVYNVIQEREYLNAPHSSIVTDHKFVSDLLTNEKSIDVANDNIKYSDKVVYGYIQIPAEKTLVLSGLVPVGTRSVQFAVTKTQRFAVEGVVNEVDTLPGKVGDVSRGHKVFIGGLDGTAGHVGATDGDPLFGGVIDGSTLKAGDVVNLVFPFLQADTLFYDGNNVGQTVAEDQDISGVLRVTYTVN